MGEADCNLPCFIKIILSGSLVSKGHDDHDGQQLQTSVGRQPEEETAHVNARLRPRPGPDGSERHSLRHQSVRGLPFGCRHASWESIWANGNARRAQFNAHGRPHDDARLADGELRSDGRPHVWTLWVQLRPGLLDDRTQLVQHDQADA